MTVHASSGSLPLLPNLDGALPDEAGAAEATRRILSLVKEKRLIDFQAYRPGTIQRMLALRIAKTGAGNHDRYYELLRDSPAEVDALIQALTVKVSGFFRNPYAFESLREAVLPELRERFPDETLRIWCAGCARGEEVYSVAILLQELASKRSGGARSFILGTDLDPQVLDAARRAEYPPEALLEVKKKYLDRYFQATGDAYTVLGELRSLVTFAPHDVTTLQAPRVGVFNNYHLILCRNLLIYLDRDLGERVIDFLARTLVRGGFLMLGEAETVPESQARTFSEIPPDLRIYRKQGGRDLP